MSLKNLAAILDPAAPDDRPLIIQVSPDGDEGFRLSYGTGRRRIAALARGLLKRGLKRGEAVAIVAANSADYLVLYMATMAAGLVSVCVNHKLPRETVAHIMKDSAIKLAIADAERAPLVPSWCRPCRSSSSTPCSIPARSCPSTWRRRKWRWCSTPRARPDSRRACR
ncbi:MAG: AMP-binding protein [Reyranella sp.]|nr:AMP-binding protein [Reyranella sp.]